MNYIKRSQHIFIAIIASLLFVSCNPGEPYFSGANQFKVNGIAPEGIKVLGTLWFHNTSDQEADHMVENLYVYMGDHERLAVNYGREHVIKVGPDARYDVSMVFYVPMDYVVDGGPEAATHLSNKKINAEFDFTIKGTATILVGNERVDMVVEEDGHVVVWPDL